MAQQSGCGMEMERERELQRGAVPLEDMLCYNEDDLLLAEDTEGEQDDDFDMSCYFTNLCAVWESWDFESETSCDVAVCESDEHEGVAGERWVNLMALSYPVEDEGAPGDGERDYATDDAGEWEVDDEREVGDGNAGEWEGEWGLLASVETAATAAAAATAKARVNTAIVKTTISTSTILEVEQGCRAEVVAVEDDRQGRGGIDEKGGMGDDDRQGMGGIDKKGGMGDNNNDNKNNNGGEAIAVMTPTTTTTTITTTTSATTKTITPGADVDPHPQHGTDEREYALVEVGNGSDTDEGRVDNVRLTRSRSLRVPHVFQTLQPGDERRLRAENRARALAAARETALAASQALAAANAAAREQAAAARAAAMANGAASAASSSGTQLGMPSGPVGTSGSVGSSQSTSQMADSQLSPLTPRGRELLELQQVERIRERLEREKEIKNRTARLDTLEADKAALEGLDESAMSDQMKVLKNSVLSLHAHVDSRLDFMQNSLDQILDLMQRPGFRPAAQSPLPLTAMSGPFPVQAGTQPSGTSAAAAQTVASSSSGPAAGATPQPQQTVPPQGQQQGHWYPKTPMKPPLAFSGEKKDEELNTWLRTVPVWVRAKRTLQEEEVITAASYLEGKAAKWLDGLVAKAGFGRCMADWAKTLTLEEFLDMVEARWHNPQEAQIATDAMLRLDQRKFKSVRELTSTIESLIVVPGIRYDDQVLLTMFVRCLPDNLRNLLASEARLEYHSFETLSRKALDLEATLGSAQPTQVDTRKKKSPQEWKKKGSRLMMVESDGTQTEIEEFSGLLDPTEYGGEETAEGSTFAAVVKTKAGGRGKGHQKSQGQAASNQAKVADWVKAGLDQEVWRDRRVRGACINCGEYGHTQYKCKNAKVTQKIPPKKPFIVTTDASQYGIGAVLAQQDGKKLRPIEYMSKKMPSKKLAKSTYERELYALYKALVHSRHFLLGQFFYLRTDHQTLKWIKTQPALSDALKRWIEVIDQYDFKLEYLKGEYNKVADALSRRADYLGALVYEFGVSEELNRWWEPIRKTLSRWTSYANFRQKTRPQKMSL
ncbi:hypothetical protein CBR_g45258 [Chara braunii]|uniref:CCHC-type domain-containing protein n=1 Tax=Chara braunii TaxID=69332 RepID=A0A388K3C4_CHABU|nr:hypothetical protein CBR_g45258 [Chara braunii]|eukprot:GBG64564.1 hypothetical protein CBR_g45258 [Chara braunii]